MKKLAFFVIAALVASFATAKDFSKVAAKEAKKYAKEGWIVSPGALPLEYQLEEAYNLQDEKDDNRYPVYLSGMAQSVGETIDAAKFQALELAKINIASQLKSQVTGLVDNSVANNQLPKEQAESVTKTVSALKTLIPATELERVVTVVECYRELPKKRKEFLIRIFYNREKAMAAASRTIKEEMARNGLEKEAKDLHEKLDKILGC